MRQGGKHGGGGSVTNKSGPVPYLAGNGETCDRCKGEGFTVVKQPAPPKRCSKCGGSGIVRLPITEIYKRAMQASGGR